MHRMRLMLPALACALGLSVGCTSTCDRPSWWSRLFDRHEPKCCKEGCCEEGCCPGGNMSGSLIYDGPVLPEGAPMMAPVPGTTPLPPPTPAPITPAPATNGRLVPQPTSVPGPQAQSQPIPYVPTR